MVQETQIGRLQLHIWDQGQSAARWSVTRQLQQTRLQPRHLPSSAILVIRQLTHKTAFSSRLAQTQQWTRQLQQQVDQLARQAVRPYHQTNGHMAQSVLFLDPVELLVCYTRDLVNRQQSWYWQEIFSLIPSQSVSEQLLVGWSTYVEGLPKTLMQLSPTVAVQAVEQLDGEQLQQIIATIHQHFGLVSATAQSRPSAQSPRPKEMAIATPPWPEWIPLPIGQGLQPRASYLLGVSHTLIQTPQLARTTQFMAQATAWVTQQEAALTSGFEAKHRADWAKAAPKDGQNTDAAYPAPPDPDGDPTIPAVLAWDAADDLTHSENARSKLAYSVKPGNRLAAKALQMDVADRPTPLLSAKRSDEVDVDGAVAEALHNTSSADEAQATRLEKASIHTALGGAFYLLNLITWLQSDARLPVHAPTNLWLAVGVLMREVLGERREQYRFDPLWVVLATLANRPSEELHAALYDEENNELAPTIHWWRQQYRDVIHAQLTQRLTIDVQLLAALFCLPAEVMITNTHIDVIIPLDAITITIRRAGLDRSPGWLPDFGYIVAFEFR